MWWKEDIACPEQIYALPNLKRKDQSGFMTQILMHNVMGKMMYALIYWLNTQQFKILPLTGVPKDRREEKAMPVLKAERKSKSG